MCVSLVAQTTPFKDEMYKPGSGVIVTVNALKYSLLMFFYYLRSLRRGRREKKDYFFFFPPPPPPFLPPYFLCFDRTVTLSKLSNGLKTCDDWMEDFTFYAEDFPCCMVVAGLCCLLPSPLSHLFFSNSIAEIYFCRRYVSGSIPNDFCE